MFDTENVLMIVGRLKTHTQVVINSLSDEGSVAAFRWAQEHAEKARMAVTLLEKLLRTHDLEVVELTDEEKCAAATDLIVAEKKVLRRVKESGRTFGALAVARDSVFAFLCLGDEGVKKILVEVTDASK